MKHTIFDSSDFRTGRQPRWTSKRKGLSCDDTLCIVGGEDEDAIKSSFFLVVGFDGNGSRTYCNDPFT
jgi:hypothetical protein